MEKCECEKAKEDLEETIKNPVQYHFPYEYGSHHLRNIMEAEMYFEERRFTCPCRKRKIQLPEEVPAGEPVSKRGNVSDVEAEDGSGSEREDIESDVEEENDETPEEEKKVGEVEENDETPEEEKKVGEVTECGPMLDSLLPRHKGSVICKICDLARASLAEGRVTSRAVRLFEEVKQNCTRCCGSADEDVLCHCAENFEWVINFASKEEKKEMGWDLGFELDE